MRTVAEIQHDVFEELTGNTAVDAADIGVAVEGGIVTLTGTVCDYAKKLAAQDAAHCCRGVLDVASDIKVHLSNELFNTSTELAAAVRRVLDWNSAVPGERVRSTVSDGWVALEGNVDSNHERVAIERTVSHLPRVFGVINHVTVSTASIDLDGIRHAIQQALPRGDEAFEGVEVALNGLTLSGRLPDWRQKLRVLDAVAHAPGVRAVEDRLVVGGPRELTAGAT